MTLVMVLFLGLTAEIMIALSLGARSVFALGLEPYAHWRVSKALLFGSTTQRALWKKPEIARALPPPRAGRIEDRLAALGTAGEAESEERRQMRGLLSQQLELIERVREHLEAAQVRRGRLVEMMRRLWQKITALSSSPALSLEDEIRALCAEARDQEHGVLGETPTATRG